MYRRLKPYGAEVTSTLDIQVGKQMQFYYLPVYFSFVEDKAGVGTVKDFVFTSSDESILTVDENGIMTGKKLGTVTVTVTAKYDNNSWFMGKVSTTVNVKEAGDVETIVQNNFVYKLKADGTATLVDARKCSANCVIPNAINHNNKSYPVTHIEAKAFSECSQLESIKFPESLICIGDYAFEYCTSLKDVVLPNKLETIKIGGFYNCTQISSIEFPASLTYVGQNSFLGSKLKTVYIPKTLTSFNYLALDEIETLESITVEEGHPNCKSIDGVLYIIDQYGYGLAKYPTARKGEVYEIDSSAGCVYLCAIEETKYLKKVIFPANMEGDNISMIQSTGGNSSVEEFGVAEGSKYLMAKDGVIYSKDGKTLYLYLPAKKDKVFTVPSGVEYMDVIGELQYLEEIYIPSSLKTIKGIKYSYNLKKVVFAKDCQITELSDSCFQGCEKLESICLPKNVAKFSDTWYGNEFLDCYALETFYVAKDAPLYSNSIWGSQVFAGCDSLVIYGYGANNKISQLASDWGKTYVNVANGTDVVVGVTFVDTDLTLKRGESKNVNAFVYPETTTSKTLQYTSSNVNVATVSSDGTVKAVSAGTCYITATATDGSGEYARCLINVKLNGELRQGSDGNWYFYTDGKINTEYTGMVQNAYGWWYIKKGTVDFSYTGMCSYNGNWMYINKGKYDTSYTGMAQNTYGWWYIKKGTVDFSYTGTVVYQGVTYSVTKGKVAK